MDLKTVLMLGHLVGLIVGLGAVTLMDLYLLRLVRGNPVSRADLQLLDFGARLAAAGLGLLWLTGLGFALVYLHRDPHLLANPKLHAKIAIVVILSANGVLLHNWVLPLIKRSVGRPYLDPWRRQGRGSPCARLPRFQSRAGGRRFSWAW